MDMEKRNELKQRFRELVDDFCSDKNITKRQREFTINHAQRVELAKKLRKALV